MKPGGRQAEVVFPFGFTLVFCANVVRLLQYFCVLCSWVLCMRIESQVSNIITIDILQSHAPLIIVLSNLKHILWALH